MTTSSIPRAHWSRVLLRTLLLVLIAYAGFALLIWVVAERMIFQPPQMGMAPAQGLLLPRKGGGMISAVHLVDPGARYTVLFSHGNAETIPDNVDYLDRMHRTGFSVLAYDYSGYGHSTGRASEAAAYVDADAAYDYLLSQGVPPERIIVHGRSLGGAVAADLASRRPVAALVLESTFVSAFRVVRPYPIVPFDRFRTVDKLPRVTVPTLVIHGTDDEVIGLWHGERLYDRLTGPRERLWVRGAGHNDLEYVGGIRYWTALRRFADGLSPGDKGE